VRPGTGAHPSILFSAGSERPTPIDLSIRVSGFGRLGGAGLHGVLHGRTVWELHPQSIPWCSDRRLLPNTPTAGEIWAWALRGDTGLTHTERKKLVQWLGTTDERHQASAA
jgi:hypothetical protein